MTTEKDLIRELAASLSNLLEQVYQMQGLFDDDDGTIQTAIDDAEKASDLFADHLRMKQL